REGVSGNRDAGRGSGGGLRKTVRASAKSTVRSWTFPSTRTRSAQMSLAAASSTDRALRLIEERVLWLATAIVDHANRVRPNPSGLKVGGHQASSASMVTLMTSLWL